MALVSAAKLDSLRSSLKKQVAVGTMNASEDGGGVGSGGGSGSADLSRATLDKLHREV
jgi:hypothetical protein